MQKIQSTNRKISGRCPYDEFSSSRAGRFTSIPCVLPRALVSRRPRLTDGPRRTQPLLHSLSTTFPNFNKVHGGLVKMYQEEVLGKRVVVQHLWLEPWDETGGRPTEVLP